MSMAEYGRAHPGSAARADARSAAQLPHVVIVGAGFGGLKAAMHLGHAPVRLTVIDRTNHHLFQPLLYQVATATLSPGEISAPIRHVLKHQRNTTVILDEVTGIDTQRRLVQTTDQDIAYDYLVLATGAQESYFGHDEWRAIAPGLKSIEDARAIRHKILRAFETAEKAPASGDLHELLTFVIVGGGPTGVELAGAIGEVARSVLSSEFRHIDPSMARIVLIEARPHVLAAFPPTLASHATRELQHLGVEVRTSTMVTDVDEHGVIANGERISAHNVFWTAGVMASPAAQWLDVTPDKAGRVPVAPDLRVPGLDTVYAIGDTVTCIQDGHPLPGVAPVAMQQGVFVAQQISHRVRQSHQSEHASHNGHNDHTPAMPDTATPPATFHYVDKGNLATVGRGFSVLHLGALKLWGLPAWFLWIAIHIYYLIGFENRLLVLFQWGIAYLTFRRGVRLITTADDRYPKRGTTPPEHTKEANQMIDID